MPSSRATCAIGRDPSITSLTASSLNSGLNLRYFLAIPCITFRARSYWIRSENNGAPQLMNVYCHADAAEQASWFGDDISFKGEGFGTLDMSTPRMIAFLLRRVGSHGSGVQRAKRLALFPA